MKDSWIGQVGVWGCGSPVETSAEGRSTDRAGRREGTDRQPCVMPRRFHAREEGYLAFPVGGEGGAKRRMRREKAARWAALQGLYLS